MTPTDELQPFGAFIRDVRGSRLVVAVLWIISCYGAYALSRDYYVGGVILALDTSAERFELAAIDAADPRKPDDMRSQAMMEIAGRIRSEANAVRSWLRK